MSQHDQQQCATVITAPESLDLLQRDEPGTFSIFLAGAIDMGAAVDWQAQVIEDLGKFEHYIMLNPRRASPFTPEMLDEQILWELEAMDQADAILMWFPATSKAPVAMFESGLWLRSGKLVIGAEQGFYRRRNLELTAQHYQVQLYDNLAAASTVAAMRAIDRGELRQGSRNQ